MRPVRLVIGAVVAVAAFAVATPSATAAEPCGSGIHYGACYVNDPGGSYTCTVGRVAVGNTVAICLIEWQP